MVTNMTAKHEIQFRIDGIQADSLPMRRLAIYISDLADLLGEHPHVYSVRIDDRNVILEMAVANASASNVYSRLQSVAANTDEWSDAATANENLNRKLIEDNASGSIRSSNQVLLEIPGTKPRRAMIEATREQDFLNGIVVRIGGEEAEVPVHLNDNGVLYVCTTTQEAAKKLAPYLFGPVVRVHGLSRWIRMPEGGWLMQEFVIHHFEEIDDSPLSVVVEKLRNDKGSGWSDFDDPFAELERIRNF